MSNIKVLKTNINQVIEVELPEGYIVNPDRTPKLNSFTNEFIISIVKVEPNIRNNDE